jgi:predicted permease
MPHGTGGSPVRRVSHELTKERNEGLPVLETTFKDVRYSLRTLKKNPGFTAVALLTLALGIGANTAIFTLLNALVFRDLPVRQPGQLVEVSTLSRQGATGPMSFSMFEALERRQRVFSGMFAWWGNGVFNVEANGAPSRGDIWAVTGNFYSELGVRALKGRLIEPADVNLRGAAPASVAVLGHGFWQRHYGGDPGVIGRTVRVEGVPFTVVGVTRPGFTGMGIANEPDVTLPLTAEPLITGSTPDKLYTGGSFWLNVTGRLNDGVTLAQARGQIESIWPQVVAASLPATYGLRQRTEFLATRVDVASAATGLDWFLRSHFTAPLYVLISIAALILLIACVNLASLALARAAARGHEIGVRVALGASRIRLARQLLTESLLLSTAGALAGLAVATWGSRALRDFIMHGYLVPSALAVNPDLRVLGFTAMLAVLTGVLFGLAPCWRAIHRDPSGILQHNAWTTGSGTGRLGRLLIITQVALSVVLLMGAGLFVRSLLKLHAVDPGFQSQGVLDVQLFPRPHGYDRIDNLSYYSQLLERIRSLPGVRAASLSHFRPGGGFEWQQSVSLSSSAPGEGVRADLTPVSPGFFATLGIRLRQGRDFNWQDNEHAPRVAILSRRLAQQLFSSGDAIGRHLRIGTEPQRQNVEVVGIAEDARLFDIRKPNVATVYVDVLQEGEYAHWSSLEVWTTGSPAAVAAAVRRAVDSFGHEYVLQTRPLREVLDRTLLNERLLAMLAAFFGALSLLLAALGLYGLMAYTVTQRTREMGIRMALGAQRRNVLWKVLREALWLVAVGMAVGVPAALAATRLIGHMLFGLAADDPATLAVASGALAAVGALAAYLPAHRATRIDPAVALRHE